MAQIAGFLVIALLLASFVFSIASAGAARRRLKRTRCTAIDTAAAGQLVKIVGQVSFGQEILQAPLTGVSCTCYSLTIDHKQREDEGRLVDVNEGVPFWLNDEHATIGVYPLLFSIVPGGSTVITHQVPRSAERLDFLYRYLERAADRGMHQEALAQLRRESPLQVSETTVREGSTVAILGYVEMQTEAGGETTLRITCPDDGPLLISDDPSMFP